MLFSEKWWSEFQRVWNEAREDKTPFGRLRALRIVLCDGAQAATIHWASDGSILRLGFDEPPSGLPQFSAPYVVWQEFVGGQVSAARLLVRGKITYTEPKVLLLTHGTRFDLLGQLASRVRVTI